MSTQRVCDGHDGLIPCQVAVEVVVPLEVVDVGEHDAPRLSPAGTPLPRLRREPTPRLEAQEGRLVITLDLFAQRLMEQGPLSQTVDRKEEQEEPRPTCPQRRGQAADEEERALGQVE